MLVVDSQMICNWRLTSHPSTWEPAGAEGGCGRGEASNSSQGALEDFLCNARSPVRKVVLFFLAKRGLPLLVLHTDFESSFPTLAKMMGIAGVLLSSLPGAAFMKLGGRWHALVVGASLIRRCEPTDQGRKYACEGVLFCCASCFDTRSHTWPGRRSCPPSSRTCSRPS